MRQGEGKYVWANGDMYEGEFYENTATGYGLFIWSSGRYSYEGYFKNGEIVPAVELPS